MRVEYCLTAESGVLVGSTAEVLRVGLDKSTIRRRRIGQRGHLLDTQPLLLGSTIKGKVRNECERILANFRDVCHAPRPDTMCPHDPSVKNPPCAVCQIFGSPTLQSRLSFSDAVADADSELSPRLARVQAGVSLSRKRRTAEDERLYYIERGVEGLRYVENVEGYLDDDIAVRQLALVIAALESLVAVGGSKSRGAGWTSARVLRVAIDGKDLDAEGITEIRAKGLEEWRESR